MKNSPQRDRVLTRWLRVLYEIYRLYCEIRKETIKPGVWESLSTAFTLGYYYLKTGQRW